MELWLQVIVSVYISTWLVMILNTYFDIIKRLETLSPNNIVMKYRIFHFLIYVVAMFFLVLFAFRIAFNDEMKERWVTSYASTLLEKK